MSTSFSPQLLNHFESLQLFLDGSETMKWIDTLPKEAIIRSKDGQLYFGRWKVVWIVLTYPFVLITSIAFEIFSHVLLVTCCHHLSRKAHVYSYYVYADASNFFTQLMWGKALLVPTPNVHQMGTSDVFTQNPLKRDEISAKEIRDHLVSKVEFVDFYKHEGRTYSNGLHIGAGLCQGEVFWFNALFLRAYALTSLKNKANTIDEYASVIAKQFEYGAPREAAILQALPGVEPKLLNLHLADPIRFTKSELDRDEKIVYQKISNLKNGNYFLGLSTHAMAYLTYDGEKYLFNPGYGLFKIRSIEELMAHIRPHIHDSSKSNYFAQIF